MEEIVPAGVRRVEYGWGVVPWAGDERVWWDIEEVRDREAEVSKERAIERLRRGCLATAVC